MTRDRKAISNLISYVLLVALVISGLGIVLSVGNPVLEESKDSAAVEEARQALLGLDSEIRSIASQGRGSATDFQFSHQQGTYGIYPGDDTINFSITTDAGIVSNGTTRQFGNLWLSGFGDSIRVSVNYTDIDLRGDHQTLSSGLHTIGIENTGAASGRTLINVTQE